MCSGFQSSNACDTLDDCCVKPGANAIIRLGSGKEEEEEPNNNNIDFERVFSDEPTKEEDITRVLSKMEELNK